ncbi:MAG: hypothetical protein KF799_08335 [Bdellovibrionales bacterium]|nr:hypothetical protein [Bdellovibrionales bacterium]
MRKIILALALTASAFAQAAGTPERVLTVSGERARLLVEAGFQFGVSDAGMGHVHMSAKDISCTKVVNASKQVIACTMVNDLGATVTLTSADPDTPTTAPLVRRLLQEITGADLKINDTTRVLLLKQISCKVTSLAFELDDLDYEPPAECTLTL